MAEIIVGVDGSQVSKLALEWAIAEAHLRSVSLRVVSVIKSPATWIGMGEALSSGVGATLSDDALLAACGDTLDEVLGTVTLPPGLNLVKDLHIGSAAKVLVTLSKDADLLVIGAQGHGEVGGVLLGSVAMHCVHHSVCPVTVVPLAR